MKGNIGNMMKQAQQMQANLQRAQAEIASLEVTGEAGGGMAKVTMTGMLLRSAKARRFFQEVQDAERYILMRYFSDNPCESALRAFSSIAR